MTYSLYIDDTRNPSTDRDWKIARDWSEVRDIIEEHGVPEHISFDHDLGKDKKDGKEVAKMMISKEWFPDSWNVHSANPIGKQRIESLIESYEKFV